MRVVDAVAERGGDGGELDAGVDPLDLERILGDVHRDAVAVADEEADRVGDVELALGVVRFEPVERGPELLGAEDVDAGVDLAEGELLGRRVARLDDAREARVVADDAPVAAPVVGLEGEDGAGGAGGCVRVEQRAQRLRSQRRDVPVQHEHVARRAGERVARRANRVAGAERLRLHRDLEPV